MLTYAMKTGISRETGNQQALFTPTRRAEPSHREEMVQEEARGRAPSDSGDTSL